MVLRRYFGGGECKSEARLDGKTIIVTGGNTGIGKVAARDFARRGTEGRTFHVVTCQSGMWSHDVKVGCGHMMSKWDVVT